MTLTPVKYQVADDVFIEKRGDDSWAVTYMGMCLTSDGEGWDYEPMPSNRTEDFIKAHRFPTPEAASEAYEKGAHDQP